VKNIMKNIRFKSLLLLLLALSAFVSANIGQSKTPPKKPAIFAVVHNGSALEPIAFIEKGKLTATVDGSDETAKKKAFGDIYYKTGSKYKLIFGGKENGDVKVTGFDPASECGSNIASIEVGTERTNINGFVMGLATNMEIKKAGSDVRRLPTRAERNEIEALIREELAKNKVTQDQIRGMKYHNLTALDVDGDGNAEQVGSFWVPLGEKERGLLFFIADQAKNGKYFFSHREFQRKKDTEVMSGEIKALEDGIYNELLLDVFDIDQDGVSEIFTWTQGFEGSSFNVYQRKAGVWKSVFEGSNYHCGY